MNLRVVKVKDVVYIRVDDVIKYLQEIGATEETDVRNRLEEAGKNFRKSASHP